MISALKLWTWSGVRHQRVIIDYYSGKYPHCMIVDCLLFIYSWARYSCLADFVSSLKHPSGLWGCRDHTHNHIYFFPHGQYQASFLIFLISISFVKYFYTSLGNFNSFSYPRQSFVVRLPKLAHLGNYTELFNADFTLPRQIYPFQLQLIDQSHMLLGITLFKLIDPNIIDKFDFLFKRYSTSIKYWYSYLLMLHLKDNSFLQFKV